MDQYAYPGSDNREYKPPSKNPRKYQSCAPTRKSKSKRLEWAIMLLFALDVLLQLAAQVVKVGVFFWWLSLGDDVVVFMLLMFLIAR